MTTRTKTVIALAAVNLVLLPFTLLVVCGGCAPADPDTATEPVEQPDVVEAYTEFLGCWYDLNLAVEGMYDELGFHPLPGDN